MSEAWSSPHLSPTYPQWIFTGVVGIAIYLAFLAALWVIATLRPRDFPPGPPIIPGLGNLHQMPIEKPYLKFHEWSKEYGDIVGLKVGTGNLVILNTPELVHELFDKRGAICSNRPVNHILTKYIHSDPEEKGIAILQYDEYYRRWRKSLQFILGAAGIKRLLPLLEAEASDLCRKFLDGGENYIDRVVHWAMAVPLVATTGERLNSQPEDYAKNTVHAQEGLLELILPGAAPPVDIFPILRYMPEALASWKSKARGVRKDVKEDAKKFLVGAKRTYEKIVRNPGSVGFDSLLPRIMTEQESIDEKTKFTDTELAFIGQGAIGAAVDTTVGTFQNLMVAFASHPEVLAKAQQEVDRCAGDVPPQWNKVDELVYLKACVSEALRWRPTTASALPHVITKDERIGQYFFPKGTTFIANVWTIHRNEIEYNRPDEFIPERFLVNPYGVRPSYKTEELENGGRKTVYTFGSGRRQCPGEQFAVTTLVIATSKLLWAYDILPPDNGLDISIETGFKDGVVTQPAHPEVVFKPRSEKRKSGVVADVERTQAIAQQLLG